MSKYGYLFANILFNCRQINLLRQLQLRRCIPASAFYKITIKDNRAIYSK